MMLTQEEFDIFQKKGTHMIVCEYKHVVDRQHGLQKTMLCISEMVRVGFHP